ncbi:MAG: FKBP-type peptidyl-prolyl cis-trans isomerase [Muribaculaceae bacterium]|nr:FKBP-type peptidyl-prolyl cis-trans isomerase [Muribaculaceae bacterium]
MAAVLSSCLGNDDDSFDYDAWINLNETYYTRMADTIGADGKKVFEKISPVWVPGVTILAQWHNDRSVTADRLVPMDNSTCDVVYECYYVNGTMLDASYKHYSDSIFKCKPNTNIVGFWAMLTNMHVGDSVTCVIPTNAAYGALSSSGVIPYSTLIYNMKLKAISAYEVAGK